MSHLEPPLQLFAFEYRRFMEGGNTKPRLISAIDDSDHTKQVVLKLRLPTTSVGTREGHYAGTSLACELICAILARTIGLKVPDYAIVKVTRDFANSIHDASIRSLFQDNIGLNFGSVYQPSFALWPSKSEKPSLDVIDQLEDILSFDSIVINGDRQISKPNLLYRGNQLLLIDHSLALPVHLWDERTIAMSPLLPEKHIKNHCATQLLMRQGRAFRRVFDKWQERINSQVLEALREMLPASWEHKRGDIDKIFAFLRGRNQRFTEMSNSLTEVFL